MGKDKEPADDAHARILRRASICEGSDVEEVEEHPVFKVGEYFESISNVYIMSHHVGVSTSTDKVPPGITWYCAKRFVKTKPFKNEQHVYFLEHIPYLRFVCRYPEKTGELYHLDRECSSLHTLVPVFKPLHPLKQLARIEEARLI